MRANFYRELEQLKGLEIDVAFVPLDPRQGKEAFGGLEAFLEYTDTRKAFPMHCWGEYDIIDRFLRKHPEYEKIRRFCRKYDVMPVSLSNEPLTDYGSVLPLIRRVG